MPFFTFSKIRNDISDFIVDNPIIRYGNGERILTTDESKERKNKELIEKLRSEIKLYNKYLIIFQIYFACSIIIILGLSIKIAIG